MEIFKDGNDVSECTMALSSLNVSVEKIDQYLTGST